MGMYLFVIHHQETRIMTYLLTLLVVLALCVLTEVGVSVLYKRYRRKAPSADALPRLGLYVDYFLDGRVDYILQGEEVPFYEILFLKRDIRTLLASGIQPCQRCIKDGKVVDENTEEFKRAMVGHEARYEKALSVYGGRLKRAHEYLAKAPYERLREMYTAPF